MSSLSIKGQRNNNRRNPGISGRRPDKYNARIVVVTANLEIWSKLTTQEKINSLDRRLGKTVGAVKQRAKLAQALLTENVKYEQHVEKQKTAKKERTKKNDR